MTKESVSKKWGKIVAVAMAAVLALSALMLAGCSSNKAPSSTSSRSSASSNLRTFSDDELLSGKHHAVLEVEGYAPVTIELDADAAPITVSNFADLVDQGYYDGLSFYRIVDGFCLQGGTAGNSPSGNDPSLMKIKGEFSGNGVENELADNFDRGVVAMARTSMPDSATSTFFVTLGDAQSVGTSLNGSYAAFGKISLQDMLVIDKIVADYLVNVDDPNMGSISDDAKQAKIVKIEMID